MTAREALTILELARPVTTESLRTAYRKAAMRFHPDRYAAFDKKVWAQEKFIRVKIAYDLLKGMNLESLEISLGTQSNESSYVHSSAKGTVFDHYSDQSDFTERDFIAWLALLRVGVALWKMLARRFGGTSVTNSPGLETALGCLLAIGMIPFMFFLFPVLYMTVMCFVVYVVFQKGLAALIQKVFGITVGPDSRGVSGQIIYLFILVLGAGGAVAFAIYILPTQKNREWMADVVTWLFVLLLVLTWFMETVLFLKIQLFKGRFGDELDAALADKKDGGK
jgi:hypothetical protein